MCLGETVKEVFLLCAFAIFPFRSILVDWKPIYIVITVLLLLANGKKR